MSGVTPTGFQPATIDELVDALNTAWRAVFGNSVNVDPRSRNGQAIAIFSEQLNEAWQSAESVAQLLNPNAAVDQGLDNLSAITGTTRLPATSSTVILTLTGTATTVVAAGKIASVPTTLAKFSTNGSQTIAAISAWVASVPYSLGQRVKKGITGTPRIYQCIVAGTAATTGPTTTDPDITDGTVHWRYLGDGTGAVDSPATATVTGPVQGYSGTITNIDTAVAGWSGVNNVLDAQAGTDREKNAPLRARRVRELGGQGNSPLPAIRAAVLRVAGVTACTVFENVSDATVDTLTPHSFECLVEGGVDADVLAAIFGAKAAGIAPIGTTSGTVTDTSGINHTVKFSRPVPVLLYVSATVTKDPNAYPIHGDSDCKDIIATVGNAQRTGRDAIGGQIGSWLYPREDDPAVGEIGVLSVSNLRVDTVNPPVTTDVVMTNRQRATYDTSRIFITSVDGTP